MPRLLAESEIAERLAGLTGWIQRGREIERRFRFADFKQAIAFVNQVAEQAEAVDHHPDITINYNRVRLTLTTHSAGGLTARDFRLAAQIDQLARPAD